MTIFSLQKFHQKAKNPRKRPIVSKFDVPKVPELYGEFRDVSIWLRLLARGSAGTVGK